MTKSSPWKITMFKNGKPSISIRVIYSMANCECHNQRVALTSIHINQYPYKSAKSFDIQSCESTSCPFLYQLSNDFHVNQYIPWHPQFFLVKSPNFSNRGFEQAPWTSHWGASMWPCHYTGRIRCLAFCLAFFCPKKGGFQGYLSEISGVDMDSMGFFPGFLGINYDPIHGLIYTILLGI